MKKAKAVGIAIILVLAIFATYMIFLRDPDSDGDGVTDEEELRLGTDPNNPNDAKKGTLIYDSSGENYATGTRGDPEEETKLAYIATETSNGGYVTTPVLMDDSFSEKPYLALKGIFKIDESDGVKTVEKYIESDEEKLDLKTDSVSESYENVEVETNAIGLVIAEHTFGFCTDPTDPLVFISLDKKPAFFTDIILSGVMLPEEFLNETDILDIDLLNDINDFIDALNLNYDLGLKFILADEITYKNETELKADVLDVITPQDLTKLVKAIGGSTIPESCYQFISDTLNHVNMELLIINELENKWNDFTLWFVVGITDLNREELQGIVTLKISEVDVNLVASKLGIDIGEPADGIFKIKYAVCGEEDPYIPAQLEYQEVTDLWDSLDDNPSGLTGFDSVEVDTFALVLDLDTLINSLEGALNIDMEYLSRITTVRNPAVALIIDQNFTECLDLKHSIFDYLAVGLFPDFQVEGTAFYLLNIKGVLYDTGIFLDLDLAQVPLIVSDSVTDGTSYAEEMSLEDIYENPNGTVEDNLITHIETDGFAMGTTMVTAASVLQYIDPTGITKIIARSPIDVGIYDVSYTSESNVHYHTGMVQFTVGKGPSYFGDHVDIHGFYFNLNEANDIMEDAFDLADGFGPLTIFTDLMDGFLSLFGHRYLDGFILAYDIESDPLNYMTVQSVEVEDEIYEEDGINVYIEGDVKNGGNTEVLPRVRTIITSPSGKKYFDSGQINYEGFWNFLPAIFLLPGQEGEFKLSKTISDPEIGVYEVDIYLVQFGEQFGFGKNLGYAHTNFTVWEGIEVTVNLTHFTMLDLIDGDFLFGYNYLADPYFKIEIWGYSDTSGIFGPNIEDENISFSFSTKVFDYINEVNITIIGWDDDLIFDEVLDLSSDGDWVDITYFIDTNTWTGDTTTNVSSGEDDGSYDVDEDDAEITFEIYDSEG